jgi:hypothetical protein
VLQRVERLFLDQAQPCAVEFADQWHHQGVGADRQNRHTQAVNRLALTRVFRQQLLLLDRTGLHLIQRIR